MGTMLWKPTEDRIRNSNMHHFMQTINGKHGQNITAYKELYEWSVKNIAEFWADIWDFAAIICSKSYTMVVDDTSRMPGAEWFKGARLNFAENLLRYRDPQTALIFKAENFRTTRMSYADLYNEVARLGNSLKAIGIVPGDRIVGYMPNMPQTIVAMLATTAIGAIWSSCSPDFGIKGVLDRFGQIKPRIIFTANGYRFKGKNFDSLKCVSEILPHLPSIEKVVVVPYTEDHPDINTVDRAILYNEFLSPRDVNEIEFEQLPFDHPVYIMYSSGTTGLPKCMVQSAGGVLINQLKELILHTDLKRDDTIFYFTTCGWMMWNWLTSSLAVGAQIVLYDGNPFYPHPGVLWEMAQDEKISIFGTSAGYLTALENSGIRPVSDYDLSSLRTILSTGSPLSEKNFYYVYDHIKKDVQLASISGGSDINGCFALGNPMDPVYSGELQCRGLGMKVEAFDDNGKPVCNQKAELVCTGAAPSMPVYFWDDPTGDRYHNAYFDVYPNIWRHGDFIEINERGGVIIYGRSDATLNPGGVRIGTAEIYRQVEGFAEVEDSLVVGQNWKDDIRIILFVKLAHGVELSNELKSKINMAIRTNASPRHIPAKIISIPDIPYTLNMKKVELAVKNIIEGKVVLNRDALSNPYSLDYFANISELREE